MKARWLAAMVATAALAGCAGGEPVNPNFAAPKLVLQPRPGGDVAAFVHAAFGERVYDWISLQADNATIANRTDAFSLEERVDRAGFYFEAAAGTARETYELRGRVDIDVEKEEARVSFVDERDEWGALHTYDLPFERVLERRPSD